MKERGYILLECMSQTDLAWNVKRLRKKGQHKHADQLESYRKLRLSRPDWNGKVRLSESNLSSADLGLPHDGEIA